MGHVKDRWTAERDGERVRTDRYGKGLRYQVWYSVDGRERCGGSFRRELDAKRCLMELEADLLRGRWADTSNRTVVTDLCRAYAASRPHIDRTARRIETFIKHHIEPTSLGSRRIVDVRPSEAQAWVTERLKAVSPLTGRPLAPSTLRQLVQLVRSAFTAAVADRLCVDNPFANVTLPKATRERVIPLTVAQVCAVADAMPEKLRAMVVAQAGLGLRLGELLALRTQDVDFLKRTVRVEHQIAEHTRDRVAPKTRQSRRTPLPSVVALVLVEHIRQNPPQADGTLFHTEGDRPYRHDYYGGRVFPAAVKAANETGARIPAGTNTHDLRHHFASVLLEAGESVIAVAERLGHENATLVLTTYEHLLPDSEDRTRKAVDAAWASNKPVADEAATAQGRPQ